jgi:iron complex outermembrane receptor protein
VRTLATGYTGDLRPGDRVLEVPAGTMSLSASWSGPRWSGTLMASRATHWVDYDRIALAKSYDRFDRRSVPLVGADLRGYWRDYDGETRLRTSVSYAINRGVSVLLTGENLLGQQLGEPDNVTILPGRTVTTGLRASFW